jgi:hypothetical protein
MALPQPLHIFRKDLRHLWPETLVVLALFAAFAWSAPSGWQNSPYAAAAPILSIFLKFLMPISWLIVISRLIHDEPLVGDRQFWTSRPYHWATLLAAKLLYLAVFLYLPFLLMQAWLLKHAGLYPTTAIPALLHNLLLLTVVIVIPLTAIAAVTSTFARMLLSVLGALIYLVILTVAFGFVAFQRMPPPALEPVLIGIFIVLPAVALVYQYATRKTTEARIMLVATPLLIFVLLFFTPAAALIRSAYPVLTGTADPKLASIPDEYAPKAPKPGELITFRKQAEITIPFTVTAVDKDSNYLIHGASVTIDTPSGVHYVSPYVAATGQFNAGAPFGLVNVPIPLEIYNKVKSAPADIHLSLATDHLKAEPMQTWKATLLPFAVPGHGVCSYSSESLNTAPTCRYPFKAPELNLVSAPLAVNSCAGPNAQPVPGVTTLGGVTGTLDFDPVVTVPLILRPRQQAPEGINFLLCPGTQLSFIEAKQQGKARFEFDEKGLILENYAAHVPQTNAQSGAHQQMQDGPNAQ